MKNKIIIIGISLTVILLIIGIIVLYNQRLTVFKTDGGAIELIKKQYPELKDYPSTNLAPKSIKSEKSSDGLYVAFIQEGSGRPIISARCFFVDKQNNIISERLYNPSFSEDSTAEFSPKTCSPGSCALETCHGLDIKCGPNPANVCTAMYGLGDKCLKYAKCGIQDGKCQQIENSEFSQCKTCIQKCINDNQNDGMKQFECESNCK